MEGPWAFLSATALLVSGWIGAAVTGRANRLSKKLELVSPTYAALQERVTLLEQDAGNRDQRFRELQASADERDKRLRDLARRVDGLVIENDNLKRDIVEDKRREALLEQRVETLQRIIRNVFDGISAILTLYKDAPAALAPDGLERLSHLLAISEAQAREVLDP